MNGTPAFTSVSLVVAVLAILSTFDHFEYRHEKYSDPALDSKASVQKMLTNSEKDIVFIENLGQIKNTNGEKSPEILFLTRSEGVDMYMTHSGLTYVFRKPEGETTDPSHNTLSSIYRLDMEFVGMNEVITIRKELAVEEQYHYYTPDHPEGISPMAYKKLTVENLYDNIDLVYYEKDGRMKYDFILKAGADAGKIQMRYKGASSVAIDNQGTLVISTPMGEIREEKPFTYSGSTEMEIGSRYQLKDNTVLFDLAKYDDSEDIIIDPVRIWATYYGGGDLDMAYDACTDGSGNLYITGRTGGTNFPTQILPGAYNQTTYGGWDAVIMKFDNTGARQWATYYGGSVTEYGFKVITDDSDNLFVAGKTSSTDFPTQTVAGAYNQTTYGGGYYDAFILKFDSNGARLWATYYGGNGDEMSDDRISMCTDNSGNLYVTGETQSSDFPTLSLAGAYNQTTLPGYSSAYILKFDNNGTRLWATHYGGNSADRGMDICTDNLGNIYVTGKAASADLPTQALSGAYNQSVKGGGSEDIFILKFNSNGARLWATYYGGSSRDQGYSISTDNSNNLFVTGRTNSTDFPIQTLPGAYNQTSYAGLYDGFILKFDNNGARQWATYYGGSDEDRPRSICTDVAGHVYVGGWTASADFPTKSLTGAYNQESFSGNRDVFLLKFNNSGTYQWATYYGGSERDEGGVIHVDNSHNIYVTGYTNSCTDFPLQVLAGAYNQTTAGNCVVGGTNWDAFVLRFNTVIADFSGSDCDIGAGESVTFTDESVGNIVSWNWIFEGGTPGTSTVQNPVITYDTMGSHSVQLIVTDGTLSDTLHKNYFITVHGSGSSNCEPNIDLFPEDPLTHSGPGSNSTTLLFAPPRWDIAFTISEISQKLNGPPSKQYIEKVIVSYIDCSGQNQTYGEFSAASSSAADISIQDVVQSITITLTDEMDGDSGSSTMSVSLDEVSSCSVPGAGCPDADGDGVCDSDDICPGYDDNIDTDGDGVPDGCDNCNSEINGFPDNPLTHSGTGSTSTSYSFGTSGHTDVSFVVTGLGAQINGNPNNRYIDLVSVTYTDAGGVQLYGTFNGENTNSAPVDIAGPVYSVTVTLEDGYDGDPPGTLSVDPGLISSCPPAGGGLQLAYTDIEWDRLDNEAASISVYPNPTLDQLTIRYQVNTDADITIRITDINGIPIRGLHSLLKVDMQEAYIDVSQIPAGIYFVHIAFGDQLISRKFVVLR